MPYTILKKSERSVGQWIKERGIREARLVEALTEKLGTGKSARRAQESPVKKKS